MNEKDEAIIELAHVARNLLKRVSEIDSKLTPMFNDAITNKIEYYASFAEKG